MDNFKRAEIKSKETPWDRFQVFIRICICLICLLCIRNINKTKFPMFHFTVNLNSRDCSVRSDDLFEVVREIYKIICTNYVNILYILIGVFVLAQILRPNIYRLGYQLHMLGMWLIFVVACIYVIANMIMIDVKPETKIELFAFALMLFLLLLVCVLLVFDIMNYKLKKEVLVVTPPVFIIVFTLLAIGGIVVFSVKMTTKYFNVSKAYRDFKELLETHSDDTTASVEYQMGNYYSGKGLYANGYMYVMGCDGLETDEEELALRNLYRVDQDGNYELFCQFYNNYRTTVQIGYYNDYLYVFSRIGDEGDKTYRMARYHVGTGEEEILFETDFFIQFGIVDDRMYYLYRSSEVRYIDLDEEISLDKSQLYLSNIDYGSMDCWDDYWLGRVLYNYRDIRTYPDRYDYGRQYYDEYVYEAEFRDELDSHDPTWGETFRLYRTETYINKFDTDLDKSYLVIDDSVHHFNIFNDKIYYIKSNDGITELWVSSMDGEEKSIVCNIDISSKFEYVGNSGKISTKTNQCIDMIVGEGYVICDFGYSKTHGIYERYLIDIESGKAEQVEIGKR